MKKKRLQLITSDEAVENKGIQHEKPCSDCPWARTALNGWLGPYTLDEWLAIAHFGNLRVDCHTIKATECAGFAIYQANNAILPRDRTLLALEPDEKLVFSNADEFRAHHKAPPTFKKRKPMASKKTAKKQPKAPEEKKERYVVLSLPEPDQSPAQLLTEIENLINIVEGDTENVTRQQYRDFLEELQGNIQARLDGLDSDDERDEG